MTVARENAKMVISYERKMAGAGDMCCTGTLFVHMSSVYRFGAKLKVAASDVTSNLSA